MYNQALALVVLSLVSTFEVVAVNTFCITISLK